MVALNERALMAGVMEEAAREIEQLRQANGTLQLYHNTVERMLALFEGGPKPQRGENNMCEDVVAVLRKTADGLRKPQEN